MEVNGFDLMLELEGEHPGADVVVLEHDGSEVFYALRGERGLRRRRWHETADGVVEVGSEVRLRPRVQYGNVEDRRMMNSRIRKDGLRIGTPAVHRGSPAERADRLYAAREQVREADKEIGDFLFGLMSRWLFDSSDRRSGERAAASTGNELFVPVPLPRYPAGGHSYVHLQHLGSDHAARSEH